MKRMIGLLMMVGLVVGVVGCGDDNNPVKSNQDLLVGTWLDEDGVPGTFRSDGTFVDHEGDEGTWSLVGDQFTIAYNDEDYGSATVTLNSVTDTELTFTDEDGERVVLTRQTNQDLLVGTWTDEAGDDWTLKADGTFVDNFEGEGTWSLVGDQLTFTYDDPDLAESGFTVTLNEVDSHTATITENGEREAL